MSKYTVQTLPPNSIHFAPLKPSIHPHLEIQLNTSALTQATERDVTSTAPCEPRESCGRSRSCAIHLHLQLPDALFVDRDEVLDLWTYSSRILYWNLKPEVIDIERPVRPTGLCKSIDDGISLDLLVGGDTQDLDIPLHARYLAPTGLGFAVIDTLGHGAFRAGVVCSEQNLYGYMNEIHGKYSP